MMKKNRLACPSVTCPFFLYLLLSIVSVSSASAQAVVTGIISDSGNGPLAGVAINVKGTNRTTASAADGSFRINATGRDVLILTFVGFITQEVSLNNRTTLSVEMVWGSGILCKRFSFF